MAAGVELDVLQYVNHARKRASRSANVIDHVKKTVEESWDEGMRLS